jgi:serine protease Do
VLGVVIQDVRAEDAEAAGLKTIHGALVGGASPGSTSPAIKAGIQAGDVIISLDGQNVDRVAELQRLIRTHKPGETVDVGVMRYGKKLDFKVTLTEAPNDGQVASAEGDEESPNVPAAYDKLGVSVEPVTADQASRVSLPESKGGLVVTDVDVNGPAYQQLQPGRDILLEVLSPEKKKLRTAEDLNSVLGKLKEGDVVSLLVYHPQAQQTTVANLRVGG